MDCSLRCCWTPRYRPKECVGIEAIGDLPPGAYCPLAAGRAALIKRPSGGLSESSITDLTNPHHPLVEGKIQGEVAWIHRGWKRLRPRHR